MIMEIVHDYKSIPLTSAEIGYLWNSYLLNSKSYYGITYVIKNIDDPNIKEVFQTAMGMSQKNLEGIKNIFDTVNHPIPYAFSQNDIRLNSGKLYSDKLILHTLKLFLSVAISQYGFALSLVARKDVKDFFKGSMHESLDLLGSIDEVALNKGIFMRTPNIPVPDKVEFAEDKSIMGRFVGNKREMTALEVASIFNTSTSNYIAKANIMALAQTMKDDIIREFYEKAVRVLKEHTEDLNEKLQNENLLVPTNLNSEILNSTESPYSDRLSLFIVYAVLADLIGTYAISKVSIMRKDLMMTLTHLSGEVLLLIKDAIDIMTKRGWYEEMPKNVDRYEIIDSNEENT
jgi:hypothetical protein